jgi:hypothetical protein
LGVAEPDDEIHRLAFQIVGLGIMLHVGLDVVQAIRPQLIASASALDTYQARLVDSSMALVDAETMRRASSDKPKNQPRLKGKSAP